MVEKEYLYQILTGTFPLTIAQLQMYQSLGSQIKIFEGEDVSFPDSDQAFLLYLKSGSLSASVSQPDNLFFRYMVYPACSAISYPILPPTGPLSRSWTITALSNTIAVSFSRAQVKILLKQDNIFLEQYMDYMSKQQLLLQKRTLMTASLTSSQRILCWLYELCQCVESQDSDILHIPCCLSQQDIADILILHTSTCNKSFSALRQNGIARKDKNHIAVCYKKLREYIEKDWKIY